MTSAQFLSACKTAAYLLKSNLWAFLLVSEINLPLSFCSASSPLQSQDFTNPRTPLPAQLHESCFSASPFLRKSCTHLQPSCGHNEGLFISQSLPLSLNCAKKPNGCNLNFTYEKLKTLINSLICLRPESIKDTTVILTKFLLTSEPNFLPRNLFY